MIRSFSLVSTIILAVVFVGCGGDGIGPESGTRVTIAFTAGSSAAQSSGAQTGPSMVPAAGHPDRLEGDDGILTFTDVWMIVAEFELEEAEGCTLDAGMHCHDFEADPRFLHLPLDGDFVPVTTDEIPEGSYDELEFEVEDLLDDDDDADLIAAVRQQILDAAAAGENVGDWPDEASMLIEGSFQETDGLMGPAIGDPRPFRVYLDAEIEIELEIDLVIPTPDGADEVTLIVDVRLDDWFKLPNGDVLDLSQFNWDPVTMEPLLEFEFEFEEDHHGFEIEIEIG